MSKRTLRYALVVLLLLPWISLAGAQDYKGIRGIFLQDGTAVEGQIVFMSADVVKIRSADGKVSSYSFLKEVDSFIKEGDFVPAKCAEDKQATEQKSVRAGGLPEIKIDKNIADCDWNTYCQAPVTAAAPVIVSRTEPVVEATPTAAPVQEKITVTLNVEFDANKTVVKEKYYDEIKKVADYLKEHPDTTAAIEGHTDNTGDAVRNKALSETRANNVRQYIIDKFGIEGQRMTATGFGGEVPVAGNDTAEGRQKNRRVEVVIETK